MEFYLAPMEGITTFIYRNAHADLFSGCGAYYGPFIVACQNSPLKGRELRDVLPENNEGIDLIPQLLGNDAPSFIAAAGTLAAMGYGQININLGCPSGTVVSKHRGSGFLADPQALDRFLEDIFSALDMKISVKTRLGLKSPEEFGPLLEIYNKYPLESLIVHPRVGIEMYKNHPRLDVFEQAYKASSNPLCCNGDIFTRGDYDKLTARFPELGRVMAGRGCAANPGLIERLAGGEPISEGRFWEFHDRVYGDYRRLYSGNANALYKMKELWFYMSAMFPGSDKQLKRINKCQHCPDYDAAVSALRREVEFDPSAGFPGTP